MVTRNRSTRRPPPQGDDVPALWAADGLGRCGLEEMGGADLEPLYDGLDGLYERIRDAAREA